MFLVSIKELDRNGTPISTDVFLRAIWKGDQSGSIILHHLHLTRI